jgi:outer membrane protein TolC
MAPFSRVSVVPTITRRKLLVLLSVGLFAGSLETPAASAEVRAIPASFATLTFDEALGLADRAPSVEGARQGATAGRKLAAAVSSQTSNPEIRVEPGYRMTQSPSSATRFEGVASISQSWNLAGLASRRRETVRAEVDSLDVQSRAIAVARRLGAAQAWIDLWAAQASLSDARQEVALATVLAERTERGAAAALLTRADAADAASYRAEARLFALSVEGETTDLGFRLARETARAPAALGTVGDLPEAPLPAPAEWPALVARAAELPEVVARRLVARADAARAAEVRAARGTAFSFGLAVTRDNLQEYVGFAQLGVTLPLFDRGEREAVPFAAAAVRGEREAEEGARTAAAELARSLHEVEHTREILEELERGFLPASAEAARLREVAFGAGDTTVVEVLVARRAAAAALTRLHRARAAHAWARVKVWIQLAELSRA